MGTVWRARDLVTGRPVAVKILHDAGGDQAQRFVREATLLAALTGGGLVDYVAHGTTADGAPYLAMAWLDGESVAERLQRGPIGLPGGVALVAAAARGLAPAHRRGVVHRDIKPSNLFLRSGAIDDVIVLDLGLARHVGGADVTRAGAILGTPAYMAPEQAQGRLDIGPAADVFSLGCVLFECLTGTAPFAAEQVLAALARVLFEEAPPLRELRPELPAPVEALVARMLSKDPGQRPADADAVVALLAALPTLPEPAAVSPIAVTVAVAAAEQELVSVILAAPARRGDDALGTPPPFPDVDSYGGQLKQLADGTAVVLLAQRRGAATDLALRAARCALRVRESRTPWTVVLATGRGFRHGADLGDAADRASHILRDRGDGDAGAIWIDATTAGLLSARVRVRDVGDGVFGLDGEAAELDPSRPLLGRPTTCVGREHELASLALAFEACIDEAQPRAALVVGPPGQGKSRLRHELVRRIQDRHPAATVLVATADPMRTSSHNPLIGAAIAPRIARHVGEPSTAAFLGVLCGVAGSDEDPAVQAARHDPRLMAAGLAKAWSVFIRAETAAAPVLLVLDDLHWSDALSVSLVDRALREVAAPLMVVGLARPEVHEAFPSLWASRVAIQPLRPLPPSATVALARQVLADRVADDAIERIAGLAAGNALYLEELIRAVAAGRDAPPQTVLAMLQARIGQLPALERRVLRAASVLGETVPIAALTALLAPTPGDELERSLDALARHEILAPAGDAARAHLRFRHALMRDAAYDLLTDDERAALHARAGRVLEAAGDDPAMIATHYERGGDRHGAIRLTVRAVERAYARHDLAAALALADRGVARGATGADLGVVRSFAAAVHFHTGAFAACGAASADALAALPAGHRRRAQALAWRACVAAQVGMTDQVEAQVDEMVAACPDPSDLGDYGSALGAAVIAHVAAGNRRAVGLMIDRLDEIDRQLGGLNPYVRGYCLYSRARFLDVLGDDPYRAWALAVEAAECAAGVNDYLMALMKLQVGRGARRALPPRVAIDALREALRLAERVGIPVGIAIVRWALASVLADHGRDDELAEAHELAASIVARAPRGTGFHAGGQVALAAVTLREGGPDAEALVRAGRAELQALSLRGFAPWADSVLLKVLIAGDPSAAGSAADDARAAVERDGPAGSIEIELRLLIARAYEVAGRRDDARRAARDALAELGRRAARVPVDRRAAFLVDVPEHGELRALAAALGVEG
jgi:tetratricopeptide (TPR) repeat protein